MKLLTLITAIALTNGVEFSRVNDNNEIIITSFEIDNSKQIQTYSNEEIKSYWEGLKSNGDVDLEKVKFIPVKYNANNNLLPDYIPDFLLVKPIPQDGVPYATIQLSIVKLGNFYTIYLYPKM